MKRKQIQEVAMLCKGSSKWDLENILADIVRSDPTDASAWYGLSKCLDDPQKAYCLNKAEEHKISAADRNLWDDPPIPAARLDALLDGIDYSRPCPICQSALKKQALLQKQRPQIFRDLIYSWVIYFGLLSILGLLLGAFIVVFG